MPPFVPYIYLSQNQSAYTYSHSQPASQRTVWHLMYISYQVIMSVAIVKAAKMDSFSSHGARHKAKSDIITDGYMQQWKVSFELFFTHTYTHTYTSIVIIIADPAPRSAYTMAKITEQRETRQERNNPSNNKIQFSPI